MKRNAFTLLELVIVISIIATLAAILFPVFARARERARRSTCASNLSQVGMALNAYAHDYDGRFPAQDNEFAPLHRYILNIDVFYCPSDSADHYWEMKSVPAGDSDLSFDDVLVPVETYSSYVYKGGLSNDDRADTPICSEAKIWHGERVNVLYIGGHVKGVPVLGYKPVVTPTKEPLDPSRTEPAPEGPLPSGGG